MSGQAVRTIIFIVFIFHGIGHVMGMLAALEVRDIAGWSNRSWLLGDRLGDTANRAVCFGVFLLVVIGFFGAGLAVMDWIVPHDGWRTWAVVSAVVALVALGVYWNALIMLFPHKIGAIAVNVAVLIGKFVVDWPSEADIGF